MTRNATREDHFVAPNYRKRMTIDLAKTCFKEFVS